MAQQSSAVASSGMPLANIADELTRASSSRDYDKLVSILQTLKDSKVAITENNQKAMAKVGGIVKSLKKTHPLHKQISELSDVIISEWKLYLYDKMPSKEESEQKKQALTSTEKQNVSAAALANLAQIRVTDKYVLFWHGCFSQFYESAFEIDGASYFCCEQYMMAMKANVFKDEEIQKQIMTETDQARIKALGRKVKNFTNTEWDKHKNEVVYRANLAKYTQNNDLKQELLKYGTKTFVEASPLDKIWGIGLKKEDVKCDDEKTWNGQNLLGVAITKVRDAILKLQTKGTGDDCKQNPQ